MKRTASLLLFLLSFLPYVKAASNDSSAHKFSVKITPSFFYVAPNPYHIRECGAMFEYLFKENMSIEFGGGYNGPYGGMNGPLDDKYVLDLGFTVRGGFRKYINTRRAGGLYINPNFFYRYMKYSGRQYKYRTTTILETEVVFAHGDDSFDDELAEEGNEIKQVIHLGFLMGSKSFHWGTGHKKPIISKHIFWEWFAGLGVRMKYRVLDIYCRDDKPLYSSAFNCNPLPEVEHKILIHYLPSAHLGIRLGFAF